MNKEKIKQFCKSIGLDCIGFMPCRRLDELKPFLQSRQAMSLQNEFEEKEIEKRINPNLYMEDGKTIISLAFPYDYEGEEKSEANGFSIYTKRADYHKVVRQYLQKVSQYIESLGGKAMCFVDSNALPERYIAYLSGVGFIGRNNMLITHKYGSYVFLGEIITDLAMECTEQRSFEEIPNYQECAACTQCIAACPTKSINLSRCNPNICLSYITQKKEISNQEMRLLKGNVFGCDFCQLKCPYNEAAEMSGIKEFETLAYMNEGISTYAKMDNSYFKEKISGTSCGWRGKNVIRRNAIIHMAHKGEAIQDLKGDSAYINDYIERLIKENNLYFSS